MKKLLFSCLTLIAALFILNGFCRLLRVEYPGFFSSTEDPINFQDDRFLLFRGTADFAWDQLVFPSHLGVDYSVRMETNKLGFRDRDFTLAKPPDTYRIVCMGDSNTFGQGVQTEETFSKRLEALLQSIASPRFEVLNMGVSGYSSVLGWELFKREVLRYDPDCLVIGFASNDSFPGLLGDYGLYTDRELLQRMESRVRSSLYDVTGILKNTSLYRVMRHVLLEGKRKITEGARSGKPRVSIQEYREILFKFSEAGRTQGVEIIFLAVGPEKRKEPHKGIQGYKEEMKKIARKQGNAFLDANCILGSGREEARTAERFRHYREMYKGLLGDRYKQVPCGDSLIYETVDCEHPNAIGHQFIAENLLSILCRKGIVSDQKTCALKKTDAHCLIP